MMIDCHYLYPKNRVSRKRKSIVEVTEKDRYTAQKLAIGMRRRMRRMCERDCRMEHQSSLMENCVKK